MVQIARKEGEKKTFKVVVRFLFNCHKPDKMICPFLSDRMSN